MQTVWRLPVADFGVGTAKSLNQLWREVASGESRLYVAAPSGHDVLLRSVSVATVHIKDVQGQV